MSNKRVPLPGINYSDSEGDSDNEGDQGMDAIIVEKKLKYEDIFGKERLTIAAYTESLFGKDRSEFVIPYPSKHKCKPEIQNQTSRFLEKVQNGFDITRSFEAKREVRNPEVYGKMVSHFEIDEFGTNFTPRLQYGEEYLDPNNFYDKLNVEQDSAMAKP